MVRDGSDLLHSWYTATDPVVHKLANRVAQSTKSQSQRTEMLWQHQASSVANGSTKHTANQLPRQVFFSD